METTERLEAPGGHREPSRHVGADSPIEKDPPTGHLADIDQRGSPIASPAPTEPQVTNVTSASTARIAVGDDE